jgi:glycine hydroxymethyltransferase
MAEQAAAPWRADAVQARTREILAGIDGLDVAAIGTRIAELAVENRRIHERECCNLNPATNVMNPTAEALLAAGLGTRASLGHAGEKYETGLEAIEQIEVITADLVRQVFGARHAEIRVPSGAIANLYGFLATCQPGDAVIVPPATIGGHVTHHEAGAAGLAGLEVHHAPIDPDRWTVDVDGLARLAREVRPRLVSIGGSLNLLPHPVSAVREVCDEVGADLLFDAAHVCGLLAGGVWPSPLTEGADLVTMSTYKSLAGPPAGLVLTDRDDLAERLDAIAYPGLTANSDPANAAALGITMLDWLEQGEAYAATMVATARRLADELASAGLPVVQTSQGPTRSHQFAVDAREWGDGQAAAARLRRANLLACGIGMPGTDGPAALRLGTPEIVRWGMGVDQMPELAELLTAALRGDPSAVAPRTTAFRAPFDRVHYVHDR